MENGPAPCRFRHPQEEDDSTPLFKAVGLDDPAIAIALLSARAPRNR